MRLRFVLVGLLAIPVLMAADASTPPAGWKEYSPKDRSFSVWLPEKSARRSERQRTMTIRGQRIKINLVVVQVAGGMSYEASTLLLPARLARGLRTKEKLEIIRDAYVNEVKGKVSSETDVKVGEVTGTEYTIQTGGGMARLRAFARAGRLYRAAVSGSNTQVTSKNAEAFLESFKLSGKAPEPDAKTPAPKGKDSDKTAIKEDTSGLKWIADSGKMKIPDAPAEGKLLGTDFKVDEAKLNPIGVLVLEKGKGDAGISIFLNIKRGENIDNKSYKLNTRGVRGEQRPHIHVVAKAADGQAKRNAFVGGYAMLLEFGKEQDKSVPGKIYLCLPDEDKSVIAGTFTLKRK